MTVSPITFQVLMSIPKIETLKHLSAVAVLATLTACGGGGGGGTTTVADAKLGISTAADTFKGSFGGDGLGQWDGAGGDGGGGGAGDGGGGAGDGEFIGFTIDFGAKTFTYKVLRSQFGVSPSWTNTLNLTPDNVNGGYTATSTGSTQPNLFLSKSGLVTGQIPLPIGTGGTLKLSTFAGARYKSAPTDLTVFAGDYAYGGMTKEVVTKANANVEHGVFRIDASGTSGRLCPDANTFTPSCANGFPFTVAFDDPANPRVLKFTSSEAHQLSGYAVASRNATTGAVTMTIDITAVSQDPGNPRITGALYATTIDPTLAVNAGSFAYAGSWSIVSTATDQTVGAGKASFSTSATFKYASNGSACPGTAGADPNNSGTGVILSGTTLDPNLKGAFVFSNSTATGSTTVGVPAGPDLMILVETDNTNSGLGSLTVLRRYNLLPGQGGACS